MLLQRRSSDEVAEDVEFDDMVAVEADADDEEPPEEHEDADESFNISPLLYGITTGVVGIADGLK